jgi:chaperone required for assembly of F1-ATPase
MNEKPVRRSYKSVSIAQRGERFGVLLDGKPAQTPGGVPLAAPSRALAEAIAEEWRAQGERLDPQSMALTALANVAIDRVGAQRGTVVEHILRFGRSDLLCYRADTPPELQVCQNATWDPLLGWARTEHGIRLVADAGIAFIEQPADALVRMQEIVSPLDDFCVAALDWAAARTASFVLAFALIEGRVDADAAFAAAEFDPLFQAEKWGRDAEADARRERLLDELKAAERFVRLLSTSP